MIKLKILDSFLIDISIMKWSNILKHSKSLCVLIFFGKFWDVTSECIRIKSVKSLILSPVMCHVDFSAT